MVKTCSSSFCLWSDQTHFCDVLGKASVPLDNKWPLLILYLRGISEVSFLSEIQKGRMQDLLIEVLQSKDFSEKRFVHVQKTIFSIITSPLSEKIEAASREAAELAVDVQNMFGKHSSSVSGIAETVSTGLHTGQEPASMLSSLRDQLKDVAAQMTEDMCALASLSQKDALTGLANRRVFDEFLDEATKKWQEESTPLSLILFDIDHFKHFNDTYGHMVGDQVLRTLAAQVKKIVKPLKDSGENLLVARYGGEEFAIILSGDVASKAKQLAEMIRKTIQKSGLTIRDTDNNVVQSGLRVTISLGVADMQTSWQNALAANLLDHSDKALYQAKSGGRNCTIAFTPGSNPPFSRVA